MTVTAPLAAADLPRLALQPEVRDYGWYVEAENGWVNADPCIDGGCGATSWIIRFGLGQVVQDAATATMLQSVYEEFYDAESNSITRYLTVHGYTDDFVENAFCNGQGQGWKTLFVSNGQVTWRAAVDGMALLTTPTSECGWHWRGYDDELSVVNPPPTSGASGACLFDSFWVLRLPGVVAAQLPIVPPSVAQDVADQVTVEIEGDGHVMVGPCSWVRLY